MACVGDEIPDTLGTSIEPEVAPVINAARGGVLTVSVPVKVPAVVLIVPPPTREVAEPAVNDTADPVSPVPGPENCVVAVIVAPEMLPVAATLLGVIAPNVKVIAGVVVAVTDPETPFAETTETEVTAEDRSAYEFVSKIQVSTAVFFKKPDVPASAAIAVKSASKD